MKKIRHFFRAMRVEQREHKSSFIVFSILRLSVVVVMVRQLINRNYESVFLCLLTLLLLIGPSVAQITLRVELPTTLEIVIFLFIYAAEILGEIRNFYLVFPYWDTLLHTFNGFLCAAIGFSLVDLLNRDPNLPFQVSPAFMVLVAISFSMTVGVIWEFFEFGMDMVFGLDMQKDTIVHSISSVALDTSGRNLPITVHDITQVSVNGADLGLGGYLDIGLIDTMADLFVNFIGAIVFSVFGFRYAKKQDAADPIQRFIPTQKDADKDYLLLAKMCDGTSDIEEKKVCKQRRRESNENRDHDR